MAQYKLWHNLWHLTLCQITQWLPLTKKYNINSEVINCLEIVYDNLFFLEDIRITLHEEENLSHISPHLLNLSNLLEKIVKTVNMPTSTSPVSFLMLSHYHFAHSMSEWQYLSFLNPWICGSGPLHLHGSYKSK